MRYLVALTLALSLSGRGATAGEDPRRADVLFELGVTEARNGNLEASLRAFEEAYRLSPHPIVAYNVAATRDALGDLKGAAAAYQLFLSLSDPKVEDEQRRHATNRLAQLLAQGRESPAVDGTTEVEIECPYPGFHVSAGLLSVGATPMRKTVKVGLSTPVQITRDGYHPEVFQPPAPGREVRFRCMPRVDPEFRGKTGKLVAAQGMAAGLVWADGFPIHLPATLPVGPHLITQSTPGAPLVSQVVMIGEGTQTLWQPKGLVPDSTKRELPHSSGPRGPNKHVRIVGYSLGLGAVGALGVGLGLVLWNDDRYRTWSEAAQHVNMLPEGSAAWLSAAQDANNLLSSIKEVDSATLAVAGAGVGLALGAALLLLLPTQRGEVLASGREVLVRVSF